MYQFLMIACTLGATVAVTSGRAVSILPVVNKIDIPSYAYRYAVHDPATRDNKAQWETRNGDVVKGSYSLVEPDGTLRVVDYTADDHSGFNAVVKKIGPAVHPPVLVTKPIAHRVTASVGPVSYGFGAKPIVASFPKSTSFGQWSLPWDPLTHSYGGWVPLAGGPSLNKPYLTILSKQYDHDGNLHKWVSKPIPLYGKRLIIKKH